MKRRSLLAGGIALLLATAPGCAFLKDLGIEVAGDSSSSKKLAPMRLVDNGPSQWSPRRAPLMDTTPMPGFSRTPKNPVRLSPYSYRIVAGGTKLADFEPKMAYKQAAPAPVRARTRYSGSVPRTRPTMTTSRAPLSI